MKAYTVSEVAEKLYRTTQLNKEEWLKLLQDMDEETAGRLRKWANEKRHYYYDDKVYMRGLIEFTNYCNKHCKYCGIRSENTKLERYRLTEDEILSCCKEGYELGYRTFVLQGGEDPYYTDEKVERLIKDIKREHPECAITLSIGEKSYESYKRYYEAGADRYLLRHETASKSLYESLHPSMSYHNRIRCLKDLKAIGYQVGTGFIVGLPGQTYKDLVEDLIFLKELEPEMVGIGPFIPQKDTPLGRVQAGTVKQTTRLISLIRLMLPKALIPATTSLGSIDAMGREKGLQAGANVVMPNLSPVAVRDKYALYDGKVCTGDEAAHCRACIEKRIEKAGFKVDMGRGDHCQ